MDYAEQYRNLPPQHDAPSWLAQLRQEAAERFAAHGFPSPRDEEWRYTNVVALEKKLFQPSETTASGVVDPALIDRYRLPEAWCLVFVDGLFVAELSQVSGLPRGALVLSLAEALKRHPEQVEAVFHRAAREENHGFVDFTTAYFRDGAFVALTAGVVLTRPVQLLHVSTRNDGLAVFRHAIALEANAEASVIETYVGAAGAAYLSAAVTEINLGDNAGLDHAKLQSESDRAHHFGGIYARQGRAARFRQHHAAFGGLLARTEIHAELGHGAECELDGVFLATGRRHLDTHTLVNHRAPHGTSRETYRGIAADRARGVFSGKIVVHPAAQKTDAELNNRNLLLSADAEIDGKPQLEIHADDVKCAHGVTVGQLDPQAIFYLQSRGVDYAAARAMLTFSFANEMLEKFRQPSLRELARDELVNLLPQSDVRKDWL